MMWPEMKERFARLREAISLIRKLWTEDRVSFEGAVLPDREGHDLRQAGRPRCRSMLPPPGPRSRNMPAVGRWLHLHQSGKDWKLYTETLLPNVAEGMTLAGKPNAGL